MWRGTAHAITCHNSPAMSWNQTEVDQNNLISFYEHRLTKIWTWISNYIHCFIWDMIIPPCPNTNGDLTHWPLTEVMVILQTVYFSNSFTN